MKRSRSIQYLVGFTAGVVLLGCGDPAPSVGDTSVNDTAQDTAIVDVSEAIDASEDAPDVADTAGVDPDVADTAIPPEDVADTTASDAEIDTAGDIQGPAPLESSLTPRPNPTNPWSSFAQVTLSQAATLNASIALAGTTDFAAIPTPGGASIDHELVVLGLQPGSTYRVRLELIVDDAAPVVHLHELAVPQAGEGYPQLELLRSAPTRMSPGFTVFNAIGAGEGPTRGLVLMVDASGTIVWSYGRSSEIFCARPLDDGTFLLLGASRITQIDRAGNTLWELDAQDDLGLDTAHHDIYAMPDGTFAVISTELRVVDGYPASTDGGATQNVVGDILVQFNRAGQVLREIRLLDLLDPYRMTSGFLSGFWNVTYRDSVPTRDWSHTNAITYDADDDSFVLSVRHLDWLVKIDAATGTLIWTLGDGGDFKLVGDGGWFYHQHSHTFADNGNVLMFDNGIGRPGGVAPFSRAVELALDDSDPDPTNWTAEVVWEWTDNTPFFSSIYGDADILENGNILILDGARTEKRERFARIIEVSHETPATTVFELKIAHPVTTYSAYRAQRVVGGVYPEALLTPPPTAAP